jgi:hypothetical protein
VLIKTPFDAIIIALGGNLMNKQENEVWKTHPEFGFIEISNLGEVRTVNRHVKRGNGKLFVKGRILKQQRNDSRGGYMQVKFTEDGKQLNKYTHRLVAEVFLPNLDNLPEINHKDNNPQNNNVLNLEWCSHEYNVAYKEKYGKSAAGVSGRPVCTVDLKTWKVSWFKSQHEASRVLGFSIGNISNVLKNQYKTTHGIWFTYANENTVEAIGEKFGCEVAYKAKRLMRAKKEK